jgi:hypothetical protein
VPTPEDFKVEVREHQRRKLDARLERQTDLLDQIRERHSWPDEIRYGKYRRARDQGDFTWSQE